MGRKARKKAEKDAKKERERMEREAAEREAKLKAQKELERKAGLANEQEQKAILGDVEDLGKGQEDLDTDVLDYGITGTGEAEAFSLDDDVKKRGRLSKALRK